VPFEIPDDIQFVRVDPNTGLLADEGQPGTVEIFAKGTEPTESAPQHVDPTDFYKLDQLADGAATGGQQR
jgi:penicillin-binding protein 1A